MPTPPIPDITGYLRATGWTVTGHWRGAEVWSRDEFDVLVPPAGDLADTAARLDELTRCVADAERRAPDAVRRDLGRVRFDVVGYRGSDATESVPAGLRALRAVRDLLAHSAREALGDDDAADALLDRARIALSDNLFGLDLALPADDAGRRTVLRVLRSCAAVRRAAESGAVPDDVPEPVCLALADLAGTDRAAAFELAFHWSPLDPRPRELVAFPPGAGAHIHAAVTVAESSTAVVAGPIIGLFDDEEGERRLIRVRGVLEVDGTATGRRRTVPVRLPADSDYELALAAHADGRSVRAEGTVTDGRPRGIAAAPDGFTVLDPPAP